jgi:hypothetical protein
MVDVTAVEELTVHPQERTNGSASTAASTGVPTPIWKRAVEAVNTLPDSRREKHGAARPPHNGIDQEPGFQLAVARAQSLIEDQQYESALYLMDRLILMVETDVLRPDASDEPRAFRNLALQRIRRRLACVPEGSEHYAEHRNDLNGNDPASGCFLTLARARVSRSGLSRRQSCAVAPPSRHSTPACASPSTGNRGNPAF